MLRIRAAVGCTAAHARAAACSFLCVLALLAWATPATAQLQPFIPTKSGLALPPGEYYYPTVPFGFSESGQFIYKREPDGNLYPWGCEYSPERNKAGSICHIGRRVQSIGPVSFEEADALARAYPNGLTAPVDAPSQHWSGLKDLIPDGRVRGLWPPYKIIDDRAVLERNRLADKRVLLVLSSDSAQAFEQLDHVQQKLATWAANQADPAVRAAVDVVVQLPTRKLLAANVTGELYSRRARPTYAEDLSQLTSENYDFAMVVDVAVSDTIDDFLRILDRDLQGRGKLSKEEIDMPVTVTLSWVVLDPALRLVAETIGNRGNWIRLTRFDDGYGRHRVIARDIEHFGSALRSSLSPTSFMKSALPSDPAPGTTAK